MRSLSEALTSRELEVLDLPARGRSNKEIGAAVFISETTVKSHLPIFSQAQRPEPH